MLQELFDNKRKREAGRKPIKKHLFLKAKERLADIQRRQVKPYLEAYPLFGPPYHHSFNQFWPHFLRMSLQLLGWVRYIRDTL